MSATASIRATDPTVPLPAGGDKLATDLGLTTISPVVCEKIAARAAGEVVGVGVVQTGMARLVPWSAAPSAGAAADVHGHTVSVDLSISVRYPQPVADTAREVRRRVTQRLRELAGLDVGGVTITVAELPADGGPGRRRRVE